MREIERRVVLSVLDRKWREHLYEMDYLREGIGLRAMAQRDPLVEYQREGYDMFNSMMDGIKEESVGNLFNLQFEIQENPIVEEVGAGAQLAFGGSLPGVTAGGAQQAPAAAGPAGAPAAPAAPRGRAAAARAARRSRRPRHRRAAVGKAPRPARRRRARPRHGGGPRPGGDPQQRRPARRRPPLPPRQETDTIPQDQASGPQPVLPARLQPRRPTQPPVLGAVRDRRRGAARREPRPTPTPAWAATTCARAVPAASTSAATAAGANSALRSPACG